MVRHSRRRRYRSGYSFEQTYLLTPSMDNWTQVAATTGTVASRQWGGSFITPVSSEGKRKFKMKSISFSSSFGGSLFYALVYVPEHTDAFKINTWATGNWGSLYSGPSQFVLSAGVLDFDGGPCRIRCSMKRNLNANDTIYLIMASTISGASTVGVCCEYFIKF